MKSNEKKKSVKANFEMSSTDQAKKKSLLMVLNPNTYKTANAITDEIDQNRPLLDKVAETINDIGSQRATEFLLQVACETETVDGLAKQAFLLNAKRLGLVIGFTSTLIYLAARRNQGYNVVEVKSGNEIKKRARSGSLFKLGRNSKEGYYERLCATAYFVIACVINSSPRVNIFEALQNTGKSAKSKEKTSNVEKLLAHFPGLSGGKVTNNFMHMLEGLAYAAKVQRGFIDNASFTEFLELLASSKYTFIQELKQTILYLIEGKNAEKLAGVEEESRNKILKALGKQHESTSSFLKTLTITRKNESGKNEEQVIAHELAGYLKQPSKSLLVDLGKFLPDYSICSPLTSQDNQIKRAGIERNYGMAQSSSSTHSSQSSDNSSVAKLSTQLGQFSINCASVKGRSSSLTLTANNPLKVAYDTFLATHKAEDPLIHAMKAAYEATTIDEKGLEQISEVGKLAFKQLKRSDLTDSERTQFQSELDLCKLLKSKHASASTSAPALGMQ